ncbi:MAG: NAD(P)H-hydrate dehydratase [Paracoccus sp. (in: a-proteobacteria)]|nr:NAD(P)H-hydrate dehydratase [Paracoccus sp. (in: a-proteobacteria)]
MMEGTEILTTAQMREVESAAIASGAVTGLDLMAHAGVGAARIIHARYPKARTVLILCGPGNNGGDGYVVARYLREAGLIVRVLAATRANLLPPDARTMAESWQAIGPVAPMTVDNVRSRDFRPDIVVDAVFGTGLTRPPEGEIAAVLEETTYLHAGVWGKHTPVIVALDGPSGLDLDTGRALSGGQPFMGASHIPLAHLTITFHSMKPGHLLEDGPEYCGEVKVVDIGLSGRSAMARVVAPESHEIQKPSGNKYDHGHVLVLAGGPLHAGAARLAARAALRVGAGLVTLCPPDLAVPPSPPDALMLRPIDSAAALAESLRDDRIRAICAGPGLGVDRARDLLPAILATKRATVLDADMLTALAEQPRALFPRLDTHVVLTPHSGEFARLFPEQAIRLREDRRYSKLDAVRDAARLSGAIVLLKGPDTVIAAPADMSLIVKPYREVAIHRADDVPWLATAGAGDVLAGMIAGLMARRARPFDAAMRAVWLHAAAARRFGPGLIADDLPDQIPGVFRDMNL